MKLGYARVSTEEQHLEVQLEQLKSARCERIYREKVSGKNLERAQLERLIRELCHGDTVIVSKLDRLARSTSALLSIVQRIAAAGASFVSLAEPWADTTSPAGTLIMTVFAGVAQFERERMIERCNAGRVLARKNGVRFGRKPLLTSTQELIATEELRRGKTPREVADMFNVDVSTIYRFRMRQNHAQQI